MEIKDITDKKTWEEFLVKNFGGDFPFFQTWNWGEVQRKINNKVYNFGLYEQKKLIGLIQIVEIAAKRGHFLYWRHGPVIPNLTPENLDFVLDFLKNLAKERKCTFIRISRFSKTEKASVYFSQKKFVASPLQTTDAQVCWILDLSPSESELLANMRKSHRYLIKKIPEFNLKIIKTKNVSEMEKFLPLYKTLSARKHFVAHHGVEEEFEIFAKDDEEVLFLAEYQGKIIAASMIAYVGNCAIYRHSASDENFKQIPASYAIQWEAIKEAKNRGKKIYNFWGIAPNEDPRHPWRGITLFKTGFGGEKEYFLPTLDLPLSFSYWKTYGIDLVSKLIR